MQPIIAQITIPSEIIAQGFIIFISITAGVAALFNFMVKRYGIGTESIRLGLQVQQNIVTDYANKSEENTQLRVHVAVLKAHIVQGLGREKALKAEIASHEKEIGILEREISRFEKTSADSVDVIRSYERRIDDKISQIERLEKELERCNEKI